MNGIDGMVRWAWLIGAVLAAVATASGSTPIFRDGKSLLPIVIPARPASSEREAAEELTRVLELMSGFAWPVYSEDQFSGKGFHVGRTRAALGEGSPLQPGADLLALRPEEIGPDGFRIRTRGGSVFIEGATPEATYYAVSWLLQREAGARWYLPGPLGEKIPQRTEWILPDLDVTRTPAYVSREIYDLNTPEARLWARRNGLRGRLEFNHALTRVFSSSTLAEKPDWAPLVRGRRYVPTSPDDYHWQPNLALPEVAVHAAEVAIATFVREPERTSFSLGVNDTVRFDQSDSTRKLVGPFRYFRGRPDYSPLVFTFMNRVAERVALSTGEGRYLGCLSYFWCENPPSFSVHPRVVPYVTTDRSQYYDSGCRAEDLDLMSRWGAAGVRAFGLWEYAEGAHFLVPRLPLSALAEAVREGWRRGARGYFAEVGPGWGFDAFKVWMLAQLLWEPDRSPSELADDFYPGFFGPAAGSMRLFFVGCEQVWMTQPGPPYWLKFYQQEDQALLFPPEVCRELRGHLEAARAAVASEPVLAERVELTSRAFAVTEAFVRFDAERRRLAAADFACASESATEQAIGNAIGRLVRKKKELGRRFAVAGEGKTRALAEFSLEPLLRNDPVPRLLWLAGQQDVAAPRRILRAAGPAVSAVREWRILAEVLADGGFSHAPNLTLNSGFTESAEAGQGPTFLFPRDGILPADWEVRATPTETGRVARVSGDPSVWAVRIEGAWDTQMFQWHPAVPGRVYVATARLRGVSSPGNDAGLFVTFLTNDNKVTGTHRMQSLPKGTMESWRVMALADCAPHDAAWVGVGVGASRQVAGDWLEVADVELRETERERKP